MDKNLFNHLGVGEIQLGGYPGKMISFSLSSHLLQADLYHLFAEQYRLHSDRAGEWKGEFWGKVVRGACLTYQATKNPALYQNIKETVLEMISLIEPDGRLSSYPREQEFHGWDLWGRKYALTGFLDFAEICPDVELRQKVIHNAARQADYILKHVGPGPRQVGILETADNYGSLNSASSLSVFLRLYAASGEQRYAAFAEYLVSTGLCRGFDLVGACLQEVSYPYQWEQTKAYEMTACVEGLVDYYAYTGAKKYLDAAVSFAKKVVSTDYTIIGGLGCSGEFFDHSSLTQTEAKRGIMQETCVTVSFMSLCERLLRCTGDPFFADILERSAYNALYGAANNENQKMGEAQALVWSGDDVKAVPHESFPFDSYSPLCDDRRGQRVGGFQLMQNGRSFGCCAANGAYGTALVSLFSLYETADGFCLNLYSDLQATTSWKGTDIHFAVKADLYENGQVRIHLRGQGARFALSLRIPAWSQCPKLTINGLPIEGQLRHGYLVIDRVWHDDEIAFDLAMALDAQVLNGKIAFFRGPVVLCGDRRLGSVEKPIALAKTPKENYGAKMAQGEPFDVNEAVEIPLTDRVLALVDYAQAGKNYDDPASEISVWQILR